MTDADAEEILWEEICCPLCSNGDEELLLAIPAEPAQTLYRLVRCRHCGMAYINPRPQAGSSGFGMAREAAAGPNPSGPSEATEGVVVPAASSFRLWLERLVLSCYHGYPPTRTQWWEKLLAVLVRPVVGLAPSSLMPLPYVGAGRLLEFSSPPGSLGQRLRQRGWDVVARPDWSGDSSQDLNWLPIQTPPASLDAVVLEGVLSQVHWPHPLIEQAARALKPGGLLAVWVPNLDSWGFRTFGMRWYPLDVPQKLLHFTPATLQRLITMHGLEVEELRYLGTTRWMRRSLQSHFLPGLLAGLLTHWTVWHKQADSLLLLARRRQPAATVRLAA